MTKTREAPVPVTRAERTLSRPVALGWPFGLAHKLTEEMDRMFENFGVRRGFFPTFPPGLEEARWIPHVEVVEKNGQLIVRTDLPGLSKEEVTVEINDEMLIIQGERKREEEEKDERFYRSERSYGNFYRAIPLPEGVNPETAKATFKDGVLEVTLPAPPAPEKRTRKVEIEGAPAKTTTKAA